MRFSEPVSTVVEKVAALEGVAPAELAPPDYDVLYDVIDPDTLDALCQSSRRNAGPIEVAFEFNGYRVTVSDDGSVTVRDQQFTGSV